MAVNTEEQQPSRAKAKPAEVAHEYFAAFAAHDVERQLACWADGGVDRTAAGTFRAPGELRAILAELHGALPDLDVEVIATVTRGNRVAVHWRGRGTFIGGPLQGVEPTGDRIELRGVDFLGVADGLIRENDAYLDAAGTARRLGVLPQREGRAEKTMIALFNLRMRAEPLLNPVKLEAVAEGVWLLRGGLPTRIMNVYLIADGDGVVLFDTGSYGMRRAVARAAYELGGIKHIILSHAHPDHRGSAPYLAAPVFCHPADLADAEGDGGQHYYDYSLMRSPLARLVEPKLIDMWDGGPVTISGTLDEGDEVAGFTVHHFPGHAPGLIGLIRPSDGLALVSDAIYTLNPETGRPCEARVAHPTFNESTEQARASIRKLAALEPRAVWPGHADPVLTDVTSRLLRAAESQ